jgi:hypothetical protein
MCPIAPNRFVLVMKHIMTSTFALSLTDKGVTEDGTFV